MVVTNIVTRHLSPRVLGICGEFSITLDDELCIHKILVINGEKGLFVAFPNTGLMKRFENSRRYLDIVHPVTSSLRQEITDKVLSHYKQECENLENS